MPSAPSPRTICLIVSNVLILLAIGIFASGFFPYKPFLPGLASFTDTEKELEALLGVSHGVPQRPRRVFDKVVFMVVDALRSNFVYGHGSGFDFTQSLIRSGNAIPFTGHATPPTVTMPRVKALTTGSVPSFVDMILNFAESDTTSSLANQDTWLAQLVQNLHSGEEGRLIFYGDDTWLKLFPSTFVRHDGTSSFFVSDFTEVDNNVTRHLPSSLSSPDWDGLIMHYLGLDHIGHKSGPNSPNMLPKQREMDGIVRDIYAAMTSQPHLENTLLVLAGDHGMNSGGNHGGSAPGETEPALVFMSPHFRSLGDDQKYNAPTAPKEGTEFAFYRTVEQSDLVPTLAGLMGVPVPKNSLGVFLEEMLGFWKEEDRVRLLAENALQVLGIVKAAFGEEAFALRPAGEVTQMRDCERLSEGKEELACLWARAQATLSVIRNDGSATEDATAALIKFLQAAQDTMSNAASQYDVSRLVGGVCLSALASATAVLALKKPWPPTLSGLASTVIIALYGVMMFASSYVEEEHHFWYWTISAWILCLCVRKMQQPSSGTGTAMSGVLLLALHRVCVRWSQTGQKHAGAADIAHTFFGSHHIILWVLVIATYLHIFTRISGHTFARLVPPVAGIFAALSLVLPAFVFKLNFTQADAPELVQGLGASIREWSAVFDLVLQARTVFVGLAITALTTTWMHALADTKTRILGPSLPERLHDLLTLFLVTQTRAQNVPLFLVFELQRQILSSLTTPDSANQGPTSKARSNTSILPTTLSILLLTHVSYFCTGGSNAISSIDLSNAYNGVSGYNVVAVGILLFVSNWAGPIWWSTVGILMILQGQRDPMAEAKLLAKEEDPRSWVHEEREKLKEDANGSLSSNKTGKSAESPWRDHVAFLTLFVAASLMAVMAACTVLRTHLFIWTVFSPKYLYAMAWAIAWNLIVNIGFGGLMYRLGGGWIKK